MNLSIVMIVVYIVGVSAVGIWFSRRNTSSKDWAVAGGGMGIFMIAVGIGGTRIGGAGTYGVAGNVISDGVWNMWWYAINTFLALAIVGLFFAIPYRRLELQTVGEIFTRRFNTRRSQTVTSLCVQTEYCIINIIEAYVIGAMLKGLTGLPMFWGVLIAALVIVTYTALGGLWGTAVTNMIHCGVILFGLAAVAILGIRDAGGWEAVTQQVQIRLAEHAAVNEGGLTRDRWWAFVGPGWGAVLGMFFSASVHTPAASVYTNYSTAAKSEKILIPGFLLAGTVAAAMPVLAGYVGILTVAEYGVDSGLASYERLTRVATDINPFIGGIALAAVLAAVISSGGPILLSSATMLVRDWLPVKTKDHTVLLRIYRITTAVYGFAAAIAAWIIAEYTEVSILDMLLFGFAMVVPPAVAVGYLIYWKRTTETACFWGMVSGYAAGLVWFLLIKYFLAIEFTAAPDDSAVRHLIAFCFTHGGIGIDPSYTTTIVPIVVVPVLSLLTPDNPEGKSKFYDILAGRAKHEDIE